MEQTIKICIPEGHRLVETKSDNGISYSFEKIDTQEDAKEFIYSLFDGLTIKLDKRYIDSVFYYKGDELLFELKKSNNNMYFYCNYNKVWTVLESKYSLNYSQVSELIADMVKEHLKMGSVRITLILS